MRGGYFRSLFLLKEQPLAIEKIGEFLRQGVLELVSIGSAAQPDIFCSMHKYRQVPMAYADACLVWLAETLGECTVLTIDSDFTIYRLARARPMRLIHPG